MADWYLCLWSMDVGHTDHSAEQTQTLRSQMDKLMQKISQRQWTVIVTMKVKTYSVAEK